MKTFPRKLLLAASISLACGNSQAETDYSVDYNVADGGFTLDFSFEENHVLLGGNIRIEDIVWPIYGSCAELETALDCTVSADVGLAYQLFIENGGRMSIIRRTLDDDGQVEKSDLGYLSPTEIREREEQRFSIQLRNSYAS